MLLFWDADQSETFQDNSFYIYQDTEINSISVSCKKKKKKDWLYKIFPNDFFNIKTFVSFLFIFYLFFIVLPLLL